MAVDKELFLYDLAVVAIMRNEAAYVEEWLEYHLAAGVDHFFIFDNESPDNFKEVLQPYIDAGFVTYEFYPGKSRQCEAYMETIKKYKFFCRYMAFIDADEFIYPQKTDKSIAEVVDEILNEQEPEKRAGLAINWMMYGSNNLETADYSKGVLERFTLRAESIHESVKTVANPRRVNYMRSPHYMCYFDSSSDVYEQKLTEEPRILVNHYSLRSREEYEKKIGNSAAYGNTTTHTVNTFTHEENNDVYDDSILAYFEKRRKQRGNVKKYQINYTRLVKTLIKTLDPLLKMKLPPDFYSGNMEMFLTCWKLSKFLKENKILESSAVDNVEIILLSAINTALHKEVTVGDVQLLLSELPNILLLKNQLVENIIKACIVRVEGIRDSTRTQINDQSKAYLWREWSHFDNILDFLKSFEVCMKN